MPLYEFECCDCKHHFEKIMSADGEAPRCPKCGGGVNKVICAPIHRFYGSGWTKPNTRKS